MTLFATDSTYPSATAARDQGRPRTDKSGTPAMALTWASRLLNEAIMGFLALVALATAIGPLVFEMTPAAERVLAAVEWVVLGLFVVEFLVQFTAARDRAGWLRSPWR